MIKKKRKRRPGGGPKDITTPRLMQALRDMGGRAWYPSHRVAARDLGIPIRSMYRALPRLMASGAVTRRYELGEDGRLGFSLSLQNDHPLPLLIVLGLSDPSFTLTACWRLRDRGSLFGHPEAPPDEPERGEQAGGEDG